MLAWWLKDDKFSEAICDSMPSCDRGRKTKNYSEKKKEKLW